jgi:hypothetical protein
MQGLSNTCDDSPSDPVVSHSGLAARQRFLHACYPDLEAISIMMLSQAAKSGENLCGARVWFARTFSRFRTGRRQRRLGVAGCRVVVGVGIST